MKGLLFTNRDDFLSSLVKTLEKQKVYVERGQDIEALSNAASLSPNFVITEFPLWNLPRGRFFSYFSRLWDEKIPTIIISSTFRFREQDNKPFVHIIPNSHALEERILEILGNYLGIELELGEEISEEDSPEIQEKLETGLSHYGVGKLQEAYREWLSILKKHNCHEKAYEYISIARKDFEEAGIDLREFYSLTSQIRELEEDFKLRGGDRYQLNMLPEKIEELTLHPFEAFILSLLDGKTTIREIWLLVPQEKRGCLKYAIHHLLQKGIIKKAN